MLTITYLNEDGLPSTTRILAEYMWDGTKIDMLNVDFRRRLVTAGFIINNMKTWIPPHRILKVDF